MYGDAGDGQGLDKLLIDNLVACAAVVVEVGLLVDVLDVGGLTAVAVVEDDIERGGVELGDVPLGAVGRGGRLAELCAGPLAVELSALVVPCVERGSGVCCHIDGVVFLLGCGVVESLDGDVRADVVAEGTAALNLGEAGGVVAAHVAAGDHDGALCAFHLDDISAANNILELDGALVGESCGLTGEDHVADLAGPFLPVLEEDAGRAGHTEDEGCRAELVAGAGGALAAGVVVVDEGDGIAAVVGVAHHALVRQCTVVAIAEGLVELELQGEVEGGRGLARTVDPVGDGLVAVPVLAYAELRLGILVVHLGVLGRVAFHHVETEAHVADFLEQELTVGLAVVLHVFRLVVEVACTAEVVAGVVVHSHLIALRGGVAAIVVLADVSTGHGVGLSVERVFLGGEVGPVGGTVAVVDDHVHDEARTLLLEGLDHVEQLLRLAERAVVIVVVHGVVAHALRLLAVARVGHPDKVEILGQLVGLSREVGPLRVVVGVPVESLEHHAAVVGRPALCKHEQGQHGSQDGCVDFLHILTF